MASVLAARALIARAARNKTYASVDELPFRRVGLVLGCPKRIPGGWLNPYFEKRIAAAVELYQRGKIEYLVVSGDNHVHGYDEPTDMKNALLEKGVPLDRIYLDYAGFRTLDSVVRVKEIFGQASVTIISQHFHNQRAIFLAAHRGIDAIGFDAPDVDPEYAWKTRSREQFARVKAVLDIYLFHKQPHFLGQEIAIGFPRAALDAGKASDLAEIMCRQLANIENTPAGMEIVSPSDPHAELYPFATDRFPVTDDVYDALINLGPSSVPCLVNRLMDTRWMPDPRDEPLLGAPVVGDVAYMVLLDKGVPDVLPELTHRNDLRMDDYFLWPSAGDHRQRLQNAVRVWLHDHPHCCGAEPVLLKPAPPQARFRMTNNQLAETRARFAKLRPGMSPEEVLTIAGKPEALEKKDEEPKNNPRLLAFTSGDHNENLAYLYFVERWTDEIGLRDPLHDRYLILYFSAEGKFTHMFSNVAEIPPIYPQSMDSWMRLMWGQDIKLK